MKWWTKFQEKRFYADNLRKLQRLGSEEVASGIERWGYEVSSRECRKGWAKASEGRRDHWRSLAKRGY